MITITVSCEKREDNADFLIKVAGVVREALSQAGMYSGSKRGEGTWTGGYKKTFEVYESLSNVPKNKVMEEKKL